MITFSRIALALITIYSLSSVSAIDSEKVIKIGKQKQLFVDHFIIDALEKVSIEVGQA